ncbi:hypothetical protein KBA73_01505, partial [Patescibacteria group bacterium]|nr:hypothetical protein [Patescibacteria group bacterium]
MLPFLAFNPASGYSAVGSALREGVGAEREGTVFLRTAETGDERRVTLKRSNIQKEKLLHWVLLFFKTPCYRFSHSIQRRAIAQLV